MPTFLLEDRSTIPEDGQEDRTAATATKLDTALARARNLARDVGREHGRTLGIVYVWEEGTQNVWSVQWHPEDPEVLDEAVTDDDGRPVLEDGEPLTRRGYRYAPEWRVVHDGSERAHDYAADDQGRQAVVNERWEGAITITDYDADGNEVPVDTATTRAASAVTHVPVEGRWAEGIESRAGEADRGE